MQHANIRSVNAWGKRNVSELTENVIAEAMAHVEKVACVPGDQRCWLLPYDAESAQATCTPKGRCKIGWIVADASRKAWDVWLDLQTDEGRLRR
jgi:hypothetical protein